MTVTSAVEVRRFSAGRAVTYQAPAGTTGLDAAEYDRVRDDLRLTAAMDHVDYPQYVGYWDAWQLAVAVVRSESKLGSQVEVGDVVLVEQQQSIAWTGLHQDARVYSVRNAINSVVPSWCVRRLDRVKALAAV